MTTLRFLHPWLLLLLALLPLLALLRGRAGRPAAVAYSGTEAARAAALPARGRPGAWLAGLRLLAAALAIVALARPQQGSGATEVRAGGIDLVLALDVSGSMESLDLTWEGQPTARVEVVKSVVAKFIAARPDDRIGLIVFAGRPYLVSPLTLDHDWLLQNLERVHTGMIEDSTAIGSAIAAGTNRLRDQNGKSKVLILLTDGENNAGKINPVTSAEAARALGIKIYTIGIGVKGEAPFPITDAFGNRRMVMIQTDVDEEMLGKIAEETGGKFFRATATDALQAIYGQIDRMEKTEHAVKKFEHYRELFPWVLLPALLLVVLELVLAQTRYRRLPA